MGTLERFIARLVGASARHPLPVLVTWLALAIVAALGATTLGQAISNNFPAPKGSEAAIAAKLVDQHFGAATGLHLIVVVQGDAAHPVASPGFLAYRRALAAKLAHDPDAAQVLTPEDLHLPAAVSPSTSFLLMTFSRPETQDVVVPRVRAEVHQVPQPAGIEPLVTDMLAIAHDIYGHARGELAKVERVGLVLSAAVLVYVFGGVFAAAIPLVTGVLCLVLGGGLLAAIAHVTETSTTNEFLAAIVGLAVGIDYPLFLLARFREELERGLSPAGDATGDAIAAFQRAGMTAGRAIAFSGTIVAVSACFLLGVDVAGLRPAALSVLGAVFFALALSFTFIPAAVFAVGRKVPVARLMRHRFASERGSRLWRWLVSGAVNHPWRHLAVNAVILAALIVPVARARFWSPTISMLPPQMESMRGLQALANAQHAGELAPIDLVVQAPKPGGAYDPAFVAGVDALVRDVQKDPRVAQVIGMTTFQPGWNLRQEQAFWGSPFLRNDPRLAALVDVKGEGRTALLRVVPTSLPDSDATRTLIADLRARIVPRHRAQLPGAVIAVGGDQAQLLDLAHAFARAMPAVGALNVLAIAVVLGFYFRSVFLPIKALVMNLLPIVAAFGVVVAVFQHGWGAAWIGAHPAGFVMIMTPAILLTVLYALSMDYEVLILSRITETYYRTGDNRRAILEGLDQTGKVVAGAATIMFSIFAAYVFADLTPMKEIGLGLAAAIAIDATLVRFSLLPATMTLMGRWNYWVPGKGVPAPFLDKTAAPTGH